MSVMAGGMLDMPMLDMPPLAPMAGDEPARAEAKGRRGLYCTGATSASDSPDLLSRQISGESEGGCSVSSLLLEPGEGSRLPPRLPFVGFLRRRSTQQVEEEEEEEADSCSNADCEESREKVLPRASPYVGFQRHAPPSPSLCFSTSSLPLVPALPGLPEAAVPMLGASCKQAQRQLPGQLPDDAWTNVLGFSVELPTLGCLSRLCRGFPEQLLSTHVWAGRPVRVPPALVPQLAPRLYKWLAIWQFSSKLVLPRSTQLISEVYRRAPGLPIEVAWRFDQHLKGDGVEVLKHGVMARRTSDEELVVLGDAALPASPSRTPYLEVRLDERGEAIGDGLNDFGFGVTACDPEEIGELGCVADEVPRSWVVDFTAASVVLSVNNHEAAKGWRVTSDDLREGDRVGLRLTPGVVEVYINGVLREQLAPAPEDCVPIGSGLFPVIDLYGRTVQVSRTDAEEPML